MVSYVQYMVMNVRFFNIWMVQKFNLLEWSLFFLKYLINDYILIFIYIKTTAVKMCTSRNTARHFRSPLVWYK